MMKELKGNRVKEKISKALFDKIPTNTFKLYVPMKDKDN